MMWNDAKVPKKLCAYAFNTLAAGSFG